MRTLFLNIFLLITVTATAQADFLILKKNNKSVKKYYPGNELSISSLSGNFTGTIEDISRDSVFLVYYDIRRYLTTNYTVIIDTVGVYHSGFPYSHITTIWQKRKGFNWSSAGTTLLGGGTLLTTAGLLTWVFSEKNTRYYASPALVGSAAALAVAGYFLMKTGDKGITIGKKYKLEYINLKED